MNNTYSYDDKCLEEGTSYTVGTNDGKEFKQVTFNGWKLMNGKSIMSFITLENQKLTVNPSFHTFIIEDTVDMADEDLMISLDSLGFEGLESDPINKVLKSTPQSVENTEEQTKHKEEISHG